MVVEAVGAEEGLVPPVVVVGAEVEAEPFVAAVEQKVEQVAVAVALASVPGPWAARGLTSSKKDGVAVGVSCGACCKDTWVASRACKGACRSLVGRSQRRSCTA